MIIDVSRGGHLSGLRVTFGIIMVVIIAYVTSGDINNGISDEIWVDK